MPAHARVYSKDEELGKRDDDFKPKRSSAASGLVRPWRWRKRRMVAAVALLVLGYLLYRNLSEGLGSLERVVGAPADSFSTVGKTAGGNVEPTGPPPKLKARDDEDEVKHYYDGPIKFFRLAISLHGITRTMGSRLQNRNILFAASSLQSAASLMPMACEMAKWDRNYVHMAFLGRDALPVDDILEVNGVSRDDCSVFFHDARADYSEYSTEKRAEVAVSGAMKHINDYMHPQAMVTDDSALEDAFFIRAMRGKAAEMGRPLIEVPAGRYEEFLWLSRLDSGSLSNWFKPTIDILIHALPNSSGGLIRLIRSLEDAYHAGFAVPKLTVELPPDIEHFAKGYLERLQWPPGDRKDPWRSSTLSLRHRIPSHHLSSEQASVRFVESFYPSNTEDNHVLVLSPQAEVSPLYLQYLHFVVLEYRYASYSTSEGQRLLGVSLDVPATYLNGSSFMTPSVRDMDVSDAPKYLDKDEYDQAGATPFLYQAPSATASLIFGDKWTTLHSFLSNRLASSHRGVAERTKKLVPETEPSWTEHLLELMRARSWSMLHLSTPFVTVHNELSQVPEEYSRSNNDPREDEAVKDSDHLAEEPFLLAADLPIGTEHVERETRHTQPLQDMLAFDGDLPELTYLPYLSYTGELINASTQNDRSEKYTALFRRRVGGCKGKDATRKRVSHVANSADDLFCPPDLDIEFDDVAEEDEVEIAREVIAETAGSQADAENAAIEAVDEEVGDGAEDEPADDPADGAGQD